MEKRERLVKTIAGEPTDRTPAALWRYFPGDDLRAADFAQAIVSFQRTYDWDFVVIHPSSTAMIADYGIQDDWYQTTDGERLITKARVKRSLDWTELRPLDPARGAIGRQIDAAKLICEALPETPVVLSLTSALDQAVSLAGNAAFLRDLRTQPDRLRSGLNILTENLLHLLDALRRLPLAGICLTAKSASYSLLTEEEYRLYGLQYDRAVMTSVHQRWWLNILRLAGELPMFRLMTALPAQVIQWSDRETDPDLVLGKSLCTGAVMAGLSTEADLLRGTPNTIRESGRDAMQRANQRRLILSAGSMLKLATPLSNLRAARAAVEV